LNIQQFVKIKFKKRLLLKNIIIQLFFQFFIFRTTNHGHRFDRPVVTGVAVIIHHPEEVVMAEVVTAVAVIIHHPEEVVTAVEDIIIATRAEEVVGVVIHGVVEADIIEVKVNMIAHMITSREVVDRY